MKRITSRKNPVLAEITEISKQPDINGFILEGEKFISDIDPKTIVRLFVTEPEKYSSLIEKAENAELFDVTAEVMEKISCSTSPSPLLAVVKKKQPPRPEKIVVLDGIQDPGNVGTIIRTAYAFGFGAVCSENSANPYSPKAVRSSAGAVISAFVERCGAAEYINGLKNDGFTVIGSALDETAVRLRDCEIPQKTAIVIGSEGQGMSEKVRKLCDKVVYIPIINVESLNAAVAAGILMERFYK